MFQVVPNIVDSKKKDHEDCEPGDRAHCDANVGLTGRADYTSHGRRIIC
jgi:hypothetical protein